MKIIFVFFSLVQFISFAYADSSCMVTIKCNVGSASCGGALPNYLETSECGIQVGNALTCEGYTGTSKAEPTQFICCKKSGTPLITTSNSKADSDCDNIGTVQ